MEVIAFKNILTGATYKVPTTLTGNSAGYFAGQLADQLGLNISAEKIRVGRAGILFRDTDIITPSMSSLEFYHAYLWNETYEGMYDNTIHILWGSGNGINSVSRYMSVFGYDENTNIARVKRIIWYERGRAVELQKLFSREPANELSDSTMITTLATNGETIVHLDYTDKCLFCDSMITWLLDR